MKFKYAISGALMMISTQLSMIRADIAGSAPKAVWALLTLLSCLCTFFGIKWFFDMVYAFSELDEKVKWHEKVLKDHKDLITELHKSQIKSQEENQDESK